jgi:hypothetical protein
MTIKNGNEVQVNIGKRLHEIIDSCLEIDVTDTSKRQRVDLQSEIQRKE